jgi:hypothetical protein
MKKTIYEIMGTTPEAVAALRELPEIKRTTELYHKIKDGTISPEERAEYDEIMKPVREMDPNVLKG